MEIKQETKSLPRNRKCGNCRYFEPAPLWRKGWCRNPRLYDRRANHLVDAATIDCEQVFRARIYWEPVPTAEVVEANAPATGFSPFVGQAPADSGQADSGRGRPASADGVLRSRITTPQATVNSANPTQATGGQLPVITRRERAAASPGLVARPSRVRNWLVENIPYYDKIDGPISRINFVKVLPWVIVGVLLLVLLLNVMGGKKTDPANSTSTPSGQTTSSSLAGNVTVGASLTAPTTAPVVSTNTNANKSVSPTTSLSTLVPTATAPAPATTAAVKKEVYAKINSAQGANFRKEPNIQPTSVIKLLANGTRVKIREGEFKKADNVTFVPVTLDGVDGWVAEIYLTQET